MKEVPVVRVKGSVRTAALAALLAACGGDDEAPAAGLPAAEPPPPMAEQPVQDSLRADSLGVAMSLSREVFAYRGAARDPFQSLIKFGANRPEPRDVRVRGINFDPRYPQRSVAALQDTTDGRRYTVRVGDIIGRIRIVEIRATEVVAVVQEFGVDRQLVLPIRRRQEDIQ
jgi:hypothetical protein